MDIGVALNSLWKTSLRCRADKTIKKIYTASRQNYALSLSPFTKNFATPQNISIQSFLGSQKTLSEQ